MKSRSYESKWNMLAAKTRTGAEKRSAFDGITQQVFCASICGKVRVLAASPQLSQIGALFCVCRSNCKDTGKYWDKLLHWSNQPHTSDTSWTMTSKCGSTLPGANDINLLWNCKRQTIDTSRSFSFRLRFSYRFLVGILVAKIHSTE